MPTINSTLSRNFGVHKRNKSQQGLLKKMLSTEFQIAVKVEKIQILNFKMLREIDNQI